MVLAGGPHPPAPELEHAHRLLPGRVDQRLLGLGLEDGGPGDLLDLGLGQPALADRLVGGRQRAEVAGGLEGGDRRPDARAGRLGHVGGGRPVPGPAPDVGRLHPAGGQELAGRGQPLDLGEGLEEPGGVGAAHRSGSSAATVGPELVGDPGEPFEEHGAMVAGGCVGAGGRRRRGPRPPGAGAGEYRLAIGRRRRRPGPAPDRKEPRHMTRVRTWSLVLLAASGLGLAACGSSSVEPDDHRRRQRHDDHGAHRPIGTIADPSPAGTCGHRADHHRPARGPADPARVEGPDRGHRPGGQGG